MARAAATPTPAPHVPAVLLSDAELQQAVLDAEQVLREEHAYAVELANAVAYRCRPELPKAENLAVKNGQPRAVFLLPSRHRCRMRGLWR